MRREQSQGNEASKHPLRGILYLIGVPIGHPDDITVRALRVLRHVDIVAAKRPAVTQSLLAHHGITARLTTYDRENAHEKVPVLIERLERGESVALVSDSGMPGIYDVGERLVRAAAERHVAIEIVPGASACSASLAISGLDGNRVLFEGACPSRARALRDMVRSLAAEPRTVVLFVSPKQLEPTIQALSNHCGDRRLVVAKDLTTDRQEVWRGTAGELLAKQLPTEGATRLVLVMEGQRRSRRKRRNRQSVPSPRRAS